MHWEGGEGEDRGVEGERTEEGEGEEDMGGRGGCCEGNFIDNIWKLRCFLHLMLTEFLISQLPFNL